MLLKNLLLSGAILSAGLAFGLASSASAAKLSYSSLVTVNYYSNFVDNGTSIQFSGSPFLTDTISSISELRDIGGHDTDPNWPGGGTIFGADFTATLNASASGVYSFDFGTDDGGYLLIDGNTVASQPSSHGIAIQSYQTFLTAGTHQLEITYDNTFCCGAVVQFSMTPEPDTWALMIIGVSGLGLVMRNARRKEEDFA